MAITKQINEDRLVVVTFDAGKNDFTVNPNPVTVPTGEHKLYFALQTINKGHAEEAVFTAIHIDGGSAACGTPRSVQGLEQLFVAEVCNALRRGAAPQRVSYMPHCSYDNNPRDVALDPTIILLPPPDGANT